MVWSSDERSGSLNFWIIHITDLIWITSPLSHISHQYPIVQGTRPEATTEYHIGDFLFSQYVILFWEINVTD